MTRPDAGPRRALGDRVLILVGRGRSQRELAGTVASVGRVGYVVEVGDEEGGRIWRHRHEVYDRRDG